VIETFDFEIELAGKLVSARLAGDPGYAAIQTIPTQHHRWSSADIPFWSSTRTPTSAPPGPISGR
jgi:hypothetical protein